MKYWAIIPAAGAGSRMAQDDTLPKQYLEINGRTLLEHSLIRLDSTNLFAGIVVVLNEDDTHWQSLTPEVSVRVITATGGKKGLRRPPQVSPKGGIWEHILALCKKLNFKMY